MARARRANPQVEDADAEESTRPPAGAGELDGAYQIGNPEEFGRNMLS